MAEGARLESVFTGNRNVGSNPTPSASFYPNAFSCRSMPPAKRAGLALLYRGTYGLPEACLAAETFSESPFSLKLCTLAKEYEVFRSMISGLL